MIELTFGDGAAGALLAARAAEGGHGQIGEILSLTQALDVGKIGVSGASGVRGDVIGRLFGFFPEGDAIVREITAQSEAALLRLDAADRAGEPVRVWACCACPGERCGLMALSAQRKSGAPLYAALIPDASGLRSCAELPARECRIHASAARPLSRAAVLEYAAQWEALVLEDAPLRAVSKGRVVSVPVEYYDAALRANLPDGPFSAALAIGRTLAAAPGARDGYLYRRLCAMCDAGELSEVTKPHADHPYSGVLRRSEATGR